MLLRIQLSQQMHTLFHPTPLPTHSQPSIPLIPSHPYIQPLRRQPHRGTKVIPPRGEVQMNALSPFTRYAVQAEDGEEGEMEGETPDQPVSGDGGGPLNTSPSSSPVRRLPRGQWW